HVPAPTSTTTFLLPNSAHIVTIQARFGPPPPEVDTMSNQAPSPPSRLASLDAYRGFIMLVMASGGFGFAEVVKRAEKAKNLEIVDNPLWRFLAYQFEHVAWTGCAFWDLIHPSFMFMVGV